MDEQLPPPSSLERVAQMLGAEPGIRFASVFGSVAAGTARPESDIDIGVLADRPLDVSRKRDLITRLAVIAGRPVDVVDLTDAGPVVTLAALRGRRIVGRGSAANAALLSRAWADAADFLPLRERTLAARRAAWIG